MEEPQPPKCAVALVWGHEEGLAVGHQADVKASGQAPHWSEGRFSPRLRQTLPQELFSSKVLQLDDHLYFDNFKKNPAVNNESLTNEETGQVCWCWMNESPACRVRVPYISFSHFFLHALVASKSALDVNVCCLTWHVKVGEGGWPASKQVQVDLSPPSSCWSSSRPPRSGQCA